MQIRDVAIWYQETTSILFYKILEPYTNYQPVFRINHFFLIPRGARKSQ